MGTAYCIVNKTKHESICFIHLPVAKRGEIINHPIATALIAFYMLQNSGDVITAASEYDLENPEYSDYAEVTDVTIDAMIAADFLIDEGRELIFDDDEDYYYRRLKFVDFDWQYK